MYPNSLKILKRLPFDKRKLYIKYVVCVPAVLNLGYLSIEKLEKIVLHKVCMSVDLYMASRHCVEISESTKYSNT